MKSYLKIAIVTAIAMAPFTSMAAGFLVQDATVTAVANTSANFEQFKITTSGGTGPCADTPIFFKPPSGSNANTEIYTRAFVIAMTAVTSNLKVDVYSYGALGCTEGAYISVKK